MRQLQDHETRQPLLFPISDNVNLLAADYQRVGNALQNQWMGHRAIAFEYHPGTADQICPAITCQLNAWLCLGSLHIVKDVQRID